MMAHKLQLAEVSSSQLVVEVQHAINTDEHLYYFYVAPDKSVIFLDINGNQDLSRTAFISNNSNYKYLCNYSTIIDCRNSSDYFGPLMVQQVASLDPEKSQKTLKFQKVNFTAKDKNGRIIEKEEQQKLMVAIPGILPPFEPQNISSKADDIIKMALDDGKTLNCSKLAMEQFMSLCAVQTNTKSFKCMEYSDIIDNSCIPVTIYHFIPHNSTSEESIHPDTAVETSVPSNSLINSFKQSYRKYCYRGAMNFKTMQKVGIYFFNEICKPNSKSHPISEFGGNILLNIAINNGIKQGYVVQKAPQNALFILNYLTTTAKLNSNLKVVEQENGWIELRKKFNTTEINGELIPDLVITAGIPEQASSSVVMFHIRCLSRLVQYGELNSPYDVQLLLQCFADCIYMCIGNDPDFIFENLDCNTRLREFLQRKIFYIGQPFAIIYDRQCRGVVMENKYMETVSIKRGGVDIRGKLLVCSTCKHLHKKVAELQDCSLMHDENKEPHEVHYAPLRSTKQHVSLKKLFLQSPENFIAESRNQILNQKKSKAKSILKNKKYISKKLTSNAEIVQEMRIDEDNFMKMIILHCGNQQKSVIGGSCRKCGFKSNSLLSLFRHMEEHFGNKNYYYCNKCEDVNFRSKKALCVHEKLMHLQKYVCSICDKVFSNSVKFIEHMNIHRVHKCYNCFKCDGKFDQLIDYVKHLRVSHYVQSANELDFKCHKCASQFYTADHLLLHKVNQNHSSPNETFKCQICNFTQVGSLEIRQHMKLHSKKERELCNFVNCSHCNLVFFSEFSLLFHENKMHSKVKLSHDLLKKIQKLEDEIQKQKSCNICYLEFKSAAEVHEHEQNYHSLPSVPLANAQQQCDPTSSPEIRQQNKVSIQIPATPPHNAGVFTYALNPLDESKISQQENLSKFLSSRIDSNGTNKDSIEINLSPNAVNVSELEESVDQMENSKASRNISKNTPWPKTVKKYKIPTQYHCSYCLRPFCSSILKAKHEKVHSNSKPLFQCEECGFVYSRKNEVLDHIRSAHAQLVQQHQQQMMQ